MAIYKARCHKTLLILLLSQSPDLGVAESRLCWVARIPKCPGNKTNLSVGISAVSQASDLLAVHEKCDGAPLGYNGNHVGLVQSLLNGWVVAVRQYWEAGSILPVESVRPIYTDIERVEHVRRRRILGAEDDAARVAFDKLHLHLKGEVAEVGGIGQAVVGKARVGCVVMVGPILEATISGILRPVDPFAIVIQGIKEGQRPIMGIRILCHRRGSSIQLGSTCCHCLGCSCNPHYGGSCGLRMQLVGVVDGNVVDETASSYKEHYKYDQQDNEAC